MIYLKAEDTTIALPKHNSKVGSNSTFSLYLIQKKDEKYLLATGMSIITDEFYFIFTINGQKPLSIGEYVYELINDETNEVIETGLLTYGEYEREPLKSIKTQQKNIQLKYDGK